MEDLAIKVENLSKRYRIGLQEKAHNSLVEAVIDWVGRPIRNFRQLRQLTQFENNKVSSREDVIWALKDVSLEVEPGEVVGVIGRNGAGKSTLLKVLSKITYPTSGRVELQGRVSSLLEVGTGFHPELTGRENIYLNGTILGMTKKEIDRKFDEIIDFSGVKKFIDTPVKRYSSGMRVRLAFSVAAHLEPEILLVDEVLSVGDAAFQQKSLGKMEEVSQQGRTVLFVSHNMGAVRSLCSRAILLEGGSLVKDDLPENTINTYLHDNEVSSVGRIRWPKGNHPESKEVDLLGIDVLSEDGEPKTNFHIDERISIKVHYRIKREIKNLRLYLRLRTTLGETVFTTFEDSSILEGKTITKGYFSAVCEIPSNLLNDITYRVYVGFDSPKHKVFISGKDYLEFNVIDTSDRYRYSKSAFDGHIRPDLNWQVKKFSGKSSILNDL
ncbi:MAG: ABC transporter ATP-binding protein [Anaerolineales bacterium]